MTAAAPLSTDVLIIGAGPAGLTAAAELAPHLPSGVLVLEREAAAGGIPRHSHHLGYGLRDMKTCISGPAYARRLIDNVLRAGAQIRTRAMVTGWSDERTVEVTSPAGRQRVTARSIILATGARERPRQARLVPGDRPAGVYTTGQLQSLVHLHHCSPGERAVIVGAELVSWSSALTLREAGCRPILMTTANAHPESPTAAATIGRLALRLPVRTRTRVTRIIGHARVEAIEVENLDTGVRTTVTCDTIVFTGNWIPDHELARTAGVDMDPRTLGPVVDTAQATTMAGIYAIGNLTHPVDTADVAALDGRAVATHVLDHLRDSRVSRPAGPRVLPGAHLKWISPGILNPAASPPRARFLAWPTEPILLPTVTIERNAEILNRQVLPWPASPGRVYRLPASLLDVPLDGQDPITVDISPTRRQLRPARSGAPRCAARPASRQQPGQHKDRPTN